MLPGTLWSFTCSPLLSWLSQDMVMTLHCIPVREEFGKLPGFYITLHRYVYKTNKAVWCNTWHGRTLTGTLGTILAALQATHLVYVYTADWTHYRRGTELGHKVWRYLWTWFSGLHQPPTRNNSSLPYFSIIKPITFLNTRSRIKPSRWNGCRPKDHVLFLILDQKD